jgi:hypothetical protein
MASSFSLFGRAAFLPDQARFARRALTAAHRGMRDLLGGRS